MFGQRCTNANSTLSRRLQSQSYILQELMDNASAILNTRYKYWKGRAIGIHVSKKQNKPSLNVNS